ncbi:response regulator transcription factor [Pseudorhodoferax sp.]|uniref:response regulator transcription factor n=1 Tax=Pseudorhodoferax sp. TaxID=1993553 RepID=UPI002DD6B715|nr:response regulator transcription factor [Pseudorhodoferax sp.]
MRLLVVDDHPLVREALVSVLAQLRPEAQVEGLGSARELRQALSSAPAADLVLLDLKLPDAHGMDLLVEIGRDNLGTAVMLLSGDLDAATVHRALQLGAAGCIPKTEPRDVLVSALGLVLAGGVYVPPLALAPGALKGPANRAGGETTPQSLGLTERQIDVLSLLMQGKNNKLICRALGLAEPTVKNHVSAILRALGVDSRTEAVLAVTRLGWNLPPPR